MPRRGGKIRVHVVSSQTGTRLPGLKLNLLVAPPAAATPAQGQTTVKQELLNRIFERERDAKNSNDSNDSKDSKETNADVPVSPSDPLLFDPAAQEATTSTRRPSGTFSMPRLLSSLHLATAVTDHAGYAKFDLSHFEPVIEELIEHAIAEGLLNGNLDVHIEVAGDRGSRRGFLETSNMLCAPSAFAAAGSGAALDAQQSDVVDDTIWSALFGACKSSQIVTGMLAKADNETVGSIASPDACDYALSPDSFVTRRPIPVGDGGCEHLTPASLPLQQFRFYRAVVREPEHAAAFSPANNPAIGHAEFFAPGANKFGDRGGEASPTGQAKIDTMLTESSFKWGELLEFEQTWRSVGHSLGEIKYSLPLAPGEAVRLAVIDWNRSDSISRTDNTESEDSLKHRQTFDRDIDEIVNGELGEQQSGSSELGGIAAGIDGMYKGSNFGISGAVRGGYAAGAAHTRGNRDISADTAQNIHANTVQRSSLVRQQYSTVVIQANQSETNTLSTRIVANMNRAHTLTVQYYEVLRHLIVRTEYKGRQTAIFIPYAPFTFTPELVRRFREQLEPALLDARRATGFDALDRLAPGMEGVYLPAQDPVITLAPATLPNGTAGTAYSATITASGGTAPYIYTVTAGAQPAGLQLQPSGTLTGTPAAGGTANFTITAKDNLGFSGVKAFTISTAASVAAAAKYTALKFTLEIQSGPGQEADTFGSVTISLDLKEPNATVQLFAKADGSFNAFKSNQFASQSGGGFTVTTHTANVTELEIARIDKVRVHWTVSKFAGENDLDGWDFHSLKIACTLHAGGKLVSGDDHVLVDWQGIEKIGLATEGHSALTFPRPADFAPDVGVPHQTMTDAVNSRLATPVMKSSQGAWTAEDAHKVKTAYRAQGLALTTSNLRLPAIPADSTGKTGSGKTSDTDIGGRNDQSGAGSTTPSKRTDTVLANLLVDHLNANQAHYNAAAWMSMDPGERRMRLAPVAGEYLGGIGDTPLAISGNLIGFSYSGPTPAELAGIEQGKDPAAEESVVTLPTRGVFAEAHLGHCNAAEQRDITRFWAFDELPVSLLPNIESLKPGTYGQLQNVTPQPLQPNTLNIVNAPSVPDPHGLADAIKLLGTANLFRDMSGLDQVNNILTKLIEAAKPPSVTGETKPPSGSGTSTGTGSTGSSGQKPPTGSGSGTGSGGATGSEGTGGGGGNGQAKPPASGAVMYADAPGLSAKDRVDQNVSDRAAYAVTLAGYPKPSGSAPIEKIMGFGDVLFQGIDVSRAQGKIDWRKVKNNNDVNFAFIKATEGKAWKDPTFEYNWSESKAEGLIVGAYHYFIVADDVDKQVDNFIQAVGTRRPPQLPPAVDVEALHNDFAAAGLSPADVVDRLKQFCDAIEDFYKVRPIIYTDENDWKAMTNNSDEFADYPLWIAYVGINDTLKDGVAIPDAPGAVIPRAPAAPKVPPAWHDVWYFWQYSWKGRIDGISTPVDLDSFSGTISELAILAGYKITDV